MRNLYFCLLLAAGSAAQPWSTFLDSSRAIDWTQNVGFTIPNYAANCSVQPTLQTGSGNAAANTTAIQNALASCDATHNVVNVPAGTYYFNGITYGSQGKQVIRGAGPNSTTLIFPSQAGCAGLGHAVCMIAGDWKYSGSGEVLPPGGSNQCTWTAGYAQGTTSITLSTCGGTPPLNKMIILDQAADLTDTGGVYICGNEATNCTYETGANNYGRSINGKLYRVQEVKQITGVTSLGDGSYSVAIAPAIYHTNYRTGQSPAAWWAGFVQNDGIENLTVDGTPLTDNGGGLLSMFSCYQCWAKNVRFIGAWRNAVMMYQTLQSVIRDSYFYGAHSHYSTSYTIEADTASNFLVENNIFQQVTTPLTFLQSTAGVVAYNFAIHNIYTDGTWNWNMFASHGSDNNFNLFEGNNTYGVTADDASGSSSQFTMFRNLLSGYQPGTTNTTVPFIFRSYIRGLNFVGNVLGQPGYHTQYETYATSGSAGTGGASEYRSIFDLGWAGTGPTCSSGKAQCDPLTRSTAMRWGNYDTVNAGIRWDSTEASPAAVPYISANFTSSYFGSLAHTLPASLYYNAKPAWWPATKAWPPIGPDVISGNVGICTGTYAGSQATASGQCTSGTLTSAWAGHAKSIPAQDCYLTVLGGPPDGSGSMRSFDAAMCYAAGAGSPAVSLSATTHNFGNQTVGVPSAGFVVNLTNNGSGVLSIASITPSGDFAAASNCPISPSTLGMGNSCTITVTFTPTVTGARSGSIAIVDNTADSPQTISLSGTGLPRQAGSIGTGISAGRVIVQ